MELMKTVFSLLVSVRLLVILHFTWFISLDGSIDPSCMDFPQVTLKMTFDEPGKAEKE